MADELNIPTHRWYEKRNHIALAKEDFSRQYIYDSGIQKIDAWINSQPWGDVYIVNRLSPPLVLDFDETYYRTEGTATDLVSAATHTRASSATYVDANGVLQTAAINVPRVGHHLWSGSAWVDAGYFHESEARTNLFLSSDDLSNASYWSPLSGASTPVATSPIMGANAWTLSGAGYLRQSGLSPAASTTHTVWFRMRLPSSPAAGKLRISIYDNNSWTFITLANGSTVSDFVYDTSGAVTRDTSAIDFLTDEGNGVYLVGAAFTTLASVTTHLVFVYPDVSNSTQPVDVATPQLETGSTPSSYIPTTTSTVTRAADVMAIPAANLPWPTEAPLAVSIQMSGTMTYADTDQVREVSFYNWPADGNNKIEALIRTSTDPHSIRFAQAAGGVFDSAVLSPPTYSPGVNVPFNVASRHGSTFVNGAADGAALTADLTPTALPDLSATDMQIGSTFMGTIDLFRVWSADITDEGIAEAST